MTDLERFIAEREAHSVPDNSRFFQYALSCTPEIARPLGSLRSLAAATEFCPLCGQNSLLLIRLVMHTFDCPTTRFITQPRGCYRELSALQTIRALLVRLVVHPGNRPPARLIAQPTAATEFCPLHGQNSLLLICLVMHTFNCPTTRLITQPAAATANCPLCRQFALLSVRLVVHPGNRPAARLIHVLPRLVPLKRFGGGAGHARLVRDDFCRAVAGEQA